MDFGSGPLPLPGKKNLKVEVSNFLYFQLDLVGGEAQAEVLGRAGAKAVSFFPSWKRWETGRPTPMLMMVAQLLLFSWPSFKMSSSIYRRQHMSCLEKGLHFI